MHESLILTLIGAGLTTVNFFYGDKWGMPRMRLIASAALAFLLAGYFTK